MDVILGILAFVFVLGLIILIHEYGHFYFAKKANVLCHEFSFGMGPVLWQTQRGETKYSIRAIPIGGYVMMAGEDDDTSLIKKGDHVRLIIKQDVVEKIVVNLKDKQYESLPILEVVDVDLYGEHGDLSVSVEGEVNGTFKVKRDGFYVLKQGEIQFSPYERSMESKSKRERFWAIFGGPLMNFLLAIVVFFIIGLMVGSPNLDEARIGAVVEEYPAAVAGIEPGSLILSINDAPVENWEDISVLLDESYSYDITYELNNEITTVHLNPRIIFYGAGFASDAFSAGLVLAGISADTLAGKAGLVAGDQLVSVDGTVVATWEEVADIFLSNVNGDEVQVTVLRDGEEITVSYLPYDLDLVQNQGVALVETQIGIGAEYSFDFLHAVSYGWIGTKQAFDSIADTLRLLISNDRVGVGDLAGPVGIYSITSRMAQGGIINLLSWLGLLSVNVGVINLLPIPALDGGRLVFLGIEAVTKRKVNRNIENRIHTLMYFALLGLFAFVTWNDILRLLNLK